MSRQQDKDSAKGSPEDKHEIETCTKKSCHECQDVECDCKANTNPEIVMIPDPEIGTENLVEAKYQILAKAKYRILARSIGQSSDKDLKPNATTRDQLTAGASSSKSETDTVKKAGINSKKNKSPSSSETGFNLKEDWFKSPSSSETGLNLKEDWFKSPSSSETTLNPKEVPKSPSSSESSPEDQIEIKTCTKKDCEECEKIKVINKGHDFEVLHTPELRLEASANDDFLHVKVKDGTKTKTKAGTSSATSDTDTMKKGSNSKEDKSPSGSESEGFELLENEDD